MPEVAAYETLLSKVGSFVKSTSVATQAITGVGFTPKAIIFWTSGGTTAGTFFTQANGDARGFIGFCADGPGGIQHRSEAVSADTTTALNSRRSSSKAICLVDNVAGVGGTVVAEADVQTLGADGFTLNWTTNNSEQQIIHYLALGGTGLEASLVENLTTATTGNFSVTGVGFKPSVVLTIGTLGTKDTTGGNNYRRRLGVGIDATHRWAVSGVANVTTNATVARVVRGDRFAVGCNPGVTTLAQESDFVSMDNDGFTLYQAMAVATLQFFLCLKVPHVAIGTMTKPVGTAPDVGVVTGLGFTPSVVLMAGVQRIVGSTPDTTLGALTVSAFTAIAAEASTVAVPSAAGSVSYQVLEKSARCIKVDNGTSTLDAEANLDAEAGYAGMFHTEGFDMAWSPNDAVATEYSYVALGGLTRPPSMHTIEMDATGQGSWVDVAEDVLIEPGISEDYGIGGTGPTDLCAGTGRLAFSLDNSDHNSAGLLGYYSPGHINCRPWFAIGISVRHRFSPAWTLYPAAEGVDLRDIVGSISQVGGVIKKTGATSSWDTGASSDVGQFLTGDGYIECTATRTDKTAFVGLHPGTPLAPFGADYAMVMWETGLIWIYEKAIFVGTFEAYSVGDVFRVAVEDGVVVYRKNGALIYTSTLEPTFPLFGAIGFYYQNSEFKDLKMRLFPEDETPASYVKFQGRLKVIAPEAGIHRNRRTACTVLDWFDEAASATISVATQIDKRADEVLATVVGAISRQPLGTDYDTADSVFPYTFDNSQAELIPALSEIQRICQSEFGRCYLRRGILRFEKRTARWYPFSALVFDNAFQTMSMSLDSLKILNKATVTVHPRTVDTVDTTVLFSKTSATQLDAGEAITIRGRYTDPAQRAQRVGGTDMRTPVATTDYTMNTLQDGTGTDLTASCSVVATYGANAVDYVVTNTGAVNGWLTKLQARGRGLYDYSPIDAVALDQDSIDVVGAHSIGLDMPYQADLGIAGPIAELLVATWVAEGYGQITAQFTPHDAEELALAMSIEVGDALAVQEDLTAINATFFVQSISIHVVEYNEYHTTFIFALQRALVSDYWLLGVAGRSELGVSTFLGPL